MGNRGRNRLPTPYLRGDDSRLALPVAEDQPMSQFEPLLTELQSVLGENLRSIVLYGSAVAGDYVPGVSGHDLLIVVERADAADLAALSAPLHRWQQKGNPPPHLFTRHELAASADVFPIELLDMQQSRRVLFGEDLLTGIKIDMPHYRMQLERELKTRLHLLRRQYLAASPDETRIAQLMVASISTFLVLLRAALRLYNDDVPPEKADALSRLTEHIPFDAAPLREILVMKTNGRPGETNVTELFHRYLIALDQVVFAVDRHLHPSATISAD